MKNSKSIPGIALLGALIICLSALTLFAQSSLDAPRQESRGQVQPIPLFDPPASLAQPSAKVAIELFEPETAKRGNPPIALFDSPISTEIGEVLELFDVPPEPEPPRLSRDKLVHADLIVTIEPDLRPIIEAYAVDGCKPCAKNEESTGDGDARIRVRWHRSQKGLTYPWHIHNYARTHGYPVFHYPTPAGEWQQAAGTRSIDELAALAGIPAKPAERSQARTGMHCHMCGRCKTVWCHNPAERANASHNCPKCGQYQDVILQ